MCSVKHYFEEQPVIIQKGRRSSVTFQKQLGILTGKIKTTTDVIFKSTNCKIDHLNFNIITEGTHFLQNTYLTQIILHFTQFNDF